MSNFYSLTLIFLLIGKCYECHSFAIMLSVYHLTININFDKATTRSNQLNTNNTDALSDFGHIGACQTSIHSH